MAVEVAHRHSFQGLAFASMFELHLALRRFGSTDLAFLRCSLDGTLYHEVGKDKENRGSHSVCQQCGALDSVFHHLWRCPSTASCRSKFPWPHLVDSLPRCLTCHCWPVLSTAWLDLQRWFVTVCEPEFPVVRPVQCDATVDLFTDGACACPAFPGTRFASWAVTQAIGPVGSLSHLDVESGWVWGVHQTAYRGELIAMWRALVHCANSQLTARIWCDNQTVVRRVRVLLNGGKLKANVSHSDILQRIAMVIQQFSLASRVRVAKVTSHCSVQWANSETEAWLFWHNQQVDELAARCNFSRPPSFWKLWGEAVAAIRFHRALHFEILKVHLAVARHKPEGTCTADEDQCGITLPPIVQPEFHRPSLHSYLTDEVLERLGRKYRHRNVLAVHGWWEQTGARYLKTSQQLHWVSGIQLFLDFFAATGYHGPFSPHHKVWFDDQSALPHTVRTDVISRTTNFLRVWVAYTKGSKLNIPHRLHRPHSACLSFWTMCYRLPWAPPRLEKLDHWMFSCLGMQASAPKDLVGVGLLEEAVSL